jgi:hypothetical protein
MADPDAYTQALLGLTKEVGWIRGEMKGITHEIREVKNLLQCKTEDCKTCKSELSGHISEIELAGSVVARENQVSINRIDTRLSLVEKQCQGESAITGWWDRSLAKWSIVMGAALGFLAFVWDLVKDVVFAGAPK